MAADAPATDSSPASSGFAYSILTLVACCWAANTIFARLAVGEVSPLLLVTLRWAGVMLLLLLVAGNTVRREWPVLRQHLWLLSGLGVLGFTGFNALFYIAAHSTTAINMSIVQGVIPVFVLLGMYVTYGEKVRLRQVFGVTLTLAGILVVVSEGRWDRLLHLALNRGDLLVVLACLLYAGYTVWLRMRPAVSALAQFSVMAAGALLASAPLTWFEWRSGDLQMPAGWYGWLLVALIALFPSFLAQVLFIRGVGIIGAGRAGIFVNLVPIVAAIFAVLFLREAFAAFHAVALALVLGGIAVAQMGRA